MTHGPPAGFGDFSLRTSSNAGCVELLNTVQQRVKPKFHVFGHIHEGRNLKAWAAILSASTHIILSGLGYGIWTNDVTTFINASICDMYYLPNNKPVVFDIEIPAGHSKDELLSEEHCIPPTETEDTRL